MFVNNALLNDEDHDKNYDIAILELKRPYETDLSRPNGYITKRAEKDNTLGNYCYPCSGFSKEKCKINHCNTSIIKRIRFSFIYMYSFP